MSSRQPSATLLAVATLLLLAGCFPGTATPTPTPTGTPTTSASPESSGTPTPTPEAEDPVAAVVVMTSSTLSVFGTDGSTLASVNYSMDGPTAVAQIAEALDADPVVTTISGEVPGPCPPATGYDFGGLLLRSPGSLWSAGSYEVIVTTATTAGGVGIETVAGQRIGVTQSAFQSAVGEFIAPYEGQPERLGFDILNPEASGPERIGTYAEFSAGTLDYLATPNQLGFIGGCS